MIIDFVKLTKGGITSIEKAIAERHRKRTWHVNQLGSVEKILKELMPDIQAELEERLNENQ